MPERKKPWMGNLFLSV